MKFIIRYFFLMVSWVAYVYIGNAAELRIGRAVVDITPPIGTPMQAPQRPPFEIKLAEAAHDPLQVKSIVFEVDHHRKAALVVCDLTSLPIRIIESARREIEARTDIDSAAVMVSATHTHTAPQIRPRFIANADAEARKKTNDFVELLPRRIADAVVAANQEMVDGYVSVAIGHEDSISFNRRFKMRDGTIQTNPGKSDPKQLFDIVGPDGPIDPDVGVIEFSNNADEPIATMINFCIHLDTIGGFRPSADFPFQMSRLLAESSGSEVMTLFAPGASGNINHYDLLDPNRIHREKNERECARIGTVLAAEVLKTKRKLEKIKTEFVRTNREIVRLGYPPEKEKILIERFENATQFFDGEVDVFNDGGRLQFEAEVQVIALGEELAWVGIPGELFVELGLAIKQASPYRFTMIHSLANGSIGYVPNRKAYPHGAYEATASRCASGSGELLVEAATRLLVQMKYGQIKSVGP